MDKEIETEEQEPSPEFVKQFNEGYTLAKYMPEIASQIADAVKETESGQAFMGGREQYLHELAMERTPSWLKRDYSDRGQNDPGDNKHKSTEEPDKDL